MVRRDSVSPEALQRAIKAKIVMSQGIETPCVLMPTRVLKTAADFDGPNWKLDVGLIPPDCLAPIETAAAAVARSLNLN